MHNRKRHAADVSRPVVGRARPYGGVGEAVIFLERKI